MPKASRAAHRLSAKPVPISKSCESEAAIRNAEGIASSSSVVGEAGADIKELRERSGNEEGLKFNFSTFQFFNFSIFQFYSIVQSPYLASENFMPMPKSCTVVG
jgi:hypothetical protein